MSTILKAENISKQYRLGNVGTGTLSHDINRAWARLRGKDDPYLKIGATNDRSKKASSDYVWALKDINFEVKQGEILGIIGKNGAGKSTLLKILSRVTSPTTGSIRTRGRIASLLEVGTGMHPELTGRENIYLNGAILGMSKSEIHAKIDEIVDFSGCEMYIDTPVKRYSSGMRVRLGFAVAAFLEPDILVVDEVLAVGDAEFQKKAIGKMQDISTGQGRTVLFVSHNMASVQQLCSRAILLADGSISSVGDVENIIKDYIDDSISIVSHENLGNRDRYNDYGTSLKFTEISIYSGNSKTNGILQIGKKINFNVQITNLTLATINNVSITISIYTKSGSFLTSLRSDAIKKIYSLQPGNNSLTASIDKLPLNKGSYYINVNCSSNGVMYDIIEMATLFEVTDGDFYGSGRLPARKRQGIFINYNYS